jgi:hypothetical protein
LFQDSRTSLLGQWPADVFYPAFARVNMKVRACCGLSTTLNPPALSGYDLGMTQEIARPPWRVANSCLRLYKYWGGGFQHPISAEITGWSNQGEETTLTSPEEAFAFLAAAVGHGVQLWAAADKDLFLSCGERLHIYFDGFSPAESASLQTSLRARGLKLDVRYEDD